MSIARRDANVKVRFCVRLILPNGQVWEVHSYGLDRPKRAVRRTRELAAMLLRVPVDGDFPPFRRAWLDVCGAGVLPRTCRAELAVNDAPAGEDAPHGWRTVLIVEPGGVRKRV